MDDRFRIYRGNSFAFFVRRFTDGKTVNVLRNTGEQSTVRVGHAVADLADVDVRASGNIVSGLDAISYETIKSIDLAPDSYDLTVTPSGATTPETIKAPGTSFAAGSETTIFAVGQFAAQSIEPVVIEDDLRSVATCKTKSAAC